MIFPLPKYESTPDERKRMSSKIFDSAYQVFDSIQYLSSFEQDAVLEMAALLFKAERQRCNERSLEKANDTLGAMFSPMIAKSDAARPPSWMRDVLNDDANGKETD